MASLSSQKMDADPLLLVSVVDTSGSAARLVAGRSTSPRHELREGSASFSRAQDAMAPTSTIG